MSLKEKMSWERIEHDSVLLAQLLLPQKESLCGVVCVTTGGMVPACLVARLLRLKDIRTACVSSYDGQQEKPLSLLHEANIQADGSGWLVIDDH